MNLFWWNVGPVVAVFVVTFVVWRFLRRSGRRQPTQPKVTISVKPLRLHEPKKQEWLLWVGDGIAPADASLLNRPVRIDGRRGTVVDFTQLRILVEWED